MPLSVEGFTKIWLVDFEFSAPAGERPDVVCMVAREFFSGETLRYWRDELKQMQQAPFDCGESSLVVAYFASAEVGCFLTLGWNPPARVLDLFTEFRCQTNGLAVSAGNGLVAALKRHNLPAIDIADKDSMRELAMRGGDYTEQEKHALLDYCESDVLALTTLLPKMLPNIDMPRALLRGQYMTSTAIMQHNGIPIDMHYFEQICGQWHNIKSSLIDAINPQYKVYDGQVFSQKRFAAYLHREDISWPLTDRGKLKLDDDTFKTMSALHPQLLQLKELRATLSRLKLAKMEIGKDGRNRCILSPFAAKTGRNQPSTSKFIFGPAVWIRHLIKPPEGHGIAYIDWSQQEFGIAAALSGDPLMKKAYASGDPYLEFAKQAKAVPPNATKSTHPIERERFKACVLAVQYGMGKESFAQRAGVSTLEAKQLLQLHRQTYRVFWEWSDHVVNYTGIEGKLHTAFGWVLYKGPEANERSIRNFPMQANGAEMLRLACIYAVQKGIKICAPVHDAIMIEAPINMLSQHIKQMQECMVQASRDVLDEFELRSDVEEIAYPDRYSDARGTQMWELVQDTLDNAPSADAA